VMYAAFTWCNVTPGHADGPTLCAGGGHRIGETLAQLLPR
jgi:hypothetical protein